MTIHDIKIFKSPPGTFVARARRKATKPARKARAFLNVTWKAGEWRVQERGSRFILARAQFKDSAIVLGTGQQRDVWERDQVTTELVIHNKANEIIDRRTYPRSSDPKGRG